MLKYTFDLGGSSIKFIKFDHENEIIEETNIEYLERKENFQIELRHALSLIKNIISNEVNDFYLGLSIPGVIDFENKKITAESAFCNVSFDIKDYFSDLKNMKKFVIDNDAKSALIGEFNFGKSNSKSATIFTIGTGVGGATIINNKIIRGKNGIAGEFSKIFSNFENFNIDDTVVKYCGTLQACYRYALKKEINFQDVNGYLLIKKYNEKETDALMILNNWTESLAKLIVSVNYVLDVDVIYIGGGISNSHEFTNLLKEKVNEICKKQLLSNINLKACSLNNKAACYGILKHLESENF